MADDIEREGDEKTCAFTPAKKDAAKEDDVLFRKPRNIAEWIESSERCMLHASERLDQIEEEMNSSDKSDK